MLKTFQEGSAVKVSFDIRGREWNDRFYVDLSAWKIEAAPAGGQAPEAQKAHAHSAEEAGSYPIEEDDDVPF